MPGLNNAVYQLSSVTGLPALLPDLLKEFAKAAIRTQPADLLSWSRDYFRARAADVAPPEKERWEPPPARPGVGVTAGLLRLLHRQLSRRAEVTLEDVERAWLGLGLERQRLTDLLELLQVAGAGHESDAAVDWFKLLALAAGQLGESLCETMKVLCHVLSDDADGGSTMPASQFVDLYCYLARVDGDIDEEDIGRVVAYVRRVADVQDGAVNQFNLDSELCPQLH